MHSNYLKIGRNLTPVTGSGLLFMDKQIAILGGFITHAIHNVLKFFLLDNGTRFTSMSLLNVRLLNKSFQILQTSK